MAKDLLESCHFRLPATQIEAMRKLADEEREQIRATAFAQPAWQRHAGADVRRGRRRSGGGEAGRVYGR